MNQLSAINAALLALGRNKISSLEDTSVEAQVAGALYEIAYASALSGFRWSFAQATTIQLSPSPLPTADGYDVYPLPAGWFSVVRLFLDSGDPVPFRLEAGAVVTLSEVPAGRKLFAQCTRRVEEGLLPPYFEALFISTLITWLALPLTEDANLKIAWEVTVKQAREDAIWMDASSGGRKSFLNVGQLNMVAGR
jgi:hypothetical protein